MRVTFKLYASLAAHLPPGARRNAVDLEVAAGATPGSLLERYRVPAEEAHLVMINGVFVAPEDRGRRALDEGDTVAVWPPVAGG